MDWYKLIEAVAEVATAGAFIATLRQLKDSREALRSNRIANETAQYQAALQLMFDWRGEIIDKPELADGFRDKPYYKDVFKEVPDIRYFHALKLLHIFECYWLLHQRQIINKEMWEGWSRNLIHFFRENREFAVVWCKANKKVFSDTFVDYIEKAVPDVLSSVRTELTQKPSAALPSAEP